MRLQTRDYGQFNTLTVPVFDTGQCLTYGVSAIGSTSVYRFLIYIFYFHLNIDSDRNRSPDLSNRTIVHLSSDQNVKKSNYYDGRGYRANSRNVAHLNVRKCTMPNVILIQRFRYIYGIRSSRVSEIM